MRVEAAGYQFAEKLRNSVRKRTLDGDNVERDLVDETVSDSKMNLATRQIMNLI